MERGLLITFEGGEGSGKTTAIQTVYEELKNREYDCIMTREPGGIRISEKIREIILNKDHTEMDAKTEALLYAASRRQHLVQKIIPALNEGKIVLCDRYVDSSLVYQGYARGIGIDNIFRINKFAIDHYLPDLTFVLDIDPALGIQRVMANDREVNRLDLEKLEFHKKVREGYNLLIDDYSNEMIKIDASQTKEKVYKDIIKELNKFLNERIK